MALSPVLLGKMGIVRIKDKKLKMYGGNLVKVYRNNVDKSEIMCYNSTCYENGNNYNNWIKLLSRNLNKMTKYLLTEQKQSDIIVL